MICTFLNATTADGYNPYRITREGIDWELPEPDNPWANIGYWSDHQIIYLQKLMEISTKIHPGRLQTFLIPADLQSCQCALSDQTLCRAAQRIRSTPLNSTGNWNRRSNARVQEHGTDGKLALTSRWQVLHTTLAENCSSLLLAKLVNFVPEGGIWMNHPASRMERCQQCPGRQRAVCCHIMLFAAYCLVFVKNLLQQVDLRSIAS